MAFLLLFLLCGITLPDAEGFSLVQVNSGNSSNTDRLYGRSNGELARNHPSHPRDARRRADSDRSDSTVDIVSVISKAIRKFLSNDNAGHSVNREASSDQFRRTKPSVLYELRPESLLDSFKDLLYSRTLQKYIDGMSRRAAIVYRTVKDELRDNNLL